MKLIELLTSWRARAEELKPFAPAAAEAFHQCATDLEVALRDERAETFNLTEASRESGYTAGHLARLIKGGKIPNAGTSSRPRIRRADLPRKATSVGSSAPALMGEPRKRRFG